MRERTVNATKFKATCLALLDEVDQHGGTITVTKRGRPVATLAPAKRKPWKSLKNSWKGQIQEVGDIVNMTDLWNPSRKTEKPGG